VALGGVPRPAQLTQSQRDLAARVGPTLIGQGLWHVGLDVVGDRVVECNVFSPGGMGDAGAFARVDFIRPLVRRFLDTL
jgi:glutathione synthase